MSTSFIAHCELSLVVAVAILSVGCATTQLKVENVANGTPSVGQIYYLPRVEFAIDVERELVACGKVEDPLPLEVENRVKVTPYLLPDLSAVYQIDYQGMRGKFKATEYTFETYPNGTLKSLNTELDDQTGDVIRGYLNGALRLASAASGGVVKELKFVPLHPPSPLTEAVEQEQLCNPQTREQLDKRAELKQNIASQETALHKAEQSVLDADARLAVARQALADARTDNRSGAHLAKKKQDVEDSHVARDNALLVRDTAKKALAASSALLAKVRKTLTVTGVHHFRPSPSGSSALVQEPIQAGLDDAIGAWIGKPPHQKTMTCNTINIAPEVCTNLQLSVAVYQSPGLTRNTNGSASEDGLVYRQPIEGLLMICAEKDCLAANGAIQVGSGQTLLMSKVSVPQLGFLATLPFVNKSFQNNSLQATFAEDGALTKVSYISNARAARQAGVFAESADSLLKFAEAKRSLPQESLNAELAKVQARTQLAEATLALERANRQLEAFRSGESDGEAGATEGK